MNNDANGNRLAPYFSGMCITASGKQLTWLIASVIVSYVLVRVIAMTKKAKNPTDHVLDAQIALAVSLLVSYLFSRHWGRTAIMLPIATIVVATMMDGMNLPLAEMQKGTLYSMGIALALVAVATIFLFNQQSSNVFPALVVFAIASASFMVNHFATKVDEKFKQVKTEYKPRAWFLGLVAALVFSMFDGFIAGALVSTGLALFVHGTAVDMFRVTQFGGSR